MAKPPKTVATKKVKLPEDIVRDLLGNIRLNFYQEMSEKWWNCERPLLVLAISHPARVLESKGALLPWDEYQGILLKILGTIKVHGTTTQIRSPGRYLLTAVQSHMRLHWEDYYVRAKTIRHQIEAATAGMGARDSVVPDNTVAALANLNRVAAAKGGRKKKQVAEPEQLGLF